MELNGASSNPLASKKTLQMGNLAELKDELLRRDAAAPEPSLNRYGLRQGAILESITRVLQSAARPMRMRDVHSLVEEMLGVEIPRSTVNAALLVHTRGRDIRFRRVQYGVYEATIARLA